MAHANYSQLRNAILSKAKASMNKQVLSEVQDKMQVAVKQTVYDAYYPIRYERRKDNGGLSSRENMVGKIASSDNNGFKFSVTNTTMPSSNLEPQVYLAPLVIMGQRRAMGSYPLTYYTGAEKHPYGQPRDFITATKKLLSPQTLAQKLKQDMTRR